MPKTLREFFQQLNRLQPVHETDLSSVPISKYNGISPKKLHEIHKLSVEIDSLIRSNGTHETESIIVDIGSGLGYLSQLLAQQFGYRVLGLEADADRVATARRRQSQYFANTMATVFYTQHFVESDRSAEFIERELIERFGISLERTRIALVGLHACADLTVTACRLFSKIPSASVLAIMPCCYHKMNVNGSCFENIPLSECMKRAVSESESWSVIINRPFLRLACQQTAARWVGMSAKQHEDHGRDMFERAVVECILEEGIVRLYTLKHLILIS